MALNDSNNLQDIGIINSTQEPLAFTPSPDITDYFAREIISRLKVGLQMTGQKVKWLQRKWDGEKCSCWDDVRQQSDANCELCYGTGWVSGFYPAKEIYVSFANIAVKQLVLQEHGIKNIITPMNWTINFPILKNKDILVKQNGERYWIDTISQTLFRSQITRQQFTSELVENSSVLYKINVGEWYVTTNM
jgi:hypothetical protein